MKKMDHRGFSLIELIIVIAIMAVLLVILVPQYLKYVERSGNATDVENASMIVEALQIYAIDYGVDSIYEPYEAVTIFAPNDNANRDPRVDQYAARALAEAGLDAMAIRAQSKRNWETWTILYKSDGHGGILFGYSQTGETPAGTESFIERMESVVPASFDIDDRTGQITMRPGK